MKLFKKKCKENKRVEKEMGEVCWKGGAVKRQWGKCEDETKWDDKGKEKRVDKTSKGIKRGRREIERERERERERGEEAGGAGERWEEVNRQRLHSATALWWGETTGESLCNPGDERKGGRHGNRAVTIGMRLSAGQADGQNYWELLISPAGSKRPGLPGTTHECTPLSSTTHRVTSPIITENTHMHTYWQIWTNTHKLLDVTVSRMQRGPRCTIIPSCPLRQCVLSHLLSAITSLFTLLPIPLFYSSGSGGGSGLRCLDSSASNPLWGHYLLIYPVRGEKAGLSLTPDGRYAEVNDTNEKKERD